MWLFNIAMSGLAAAKQPQLSVEAVVREHGPYVWRVLTYLGISQADVPDLSQEVFVVVHRRLEGFEARSSLKTWLYSICTRVASGHRRKLSRRKEDAREHLPEGSEDAAQLDSLAQAQLRMMLLELLDTLDDKKREAFVLQEVEHLPASQVAEILDVPLGTIYSRVRAAKQELKRAIEARQRQGEVF